MPPAIGQCVETHPAPPNTWGNSITAYAEISPPMLDPITNVSDGPVNVRYCASMNGFSSVARKAR